MLTFLFWNIRGKDLSTNIVRLVNHHKVDIIILAETEGITSLRADILAALNSFHYLPEGSVCTRLKIFTRYPSTSVRLVGEGDRYRAHAFPLKDNHHLILFACHFISLMNRDDYTLNADARSHAHDLRELETKESHRLSVVVGDLNLNPFAPAIAFEDGFCGLMSKTLACQREKDKRVQAKPFYNPMWGHLGDASPGPPGSYYYSSGGSASRYFWHTFDQVLLRPGLLSVWKDEYLIRPTGDSVVNFLTKTGVPNKKTSDHLPLIFKLDLDLKL